MIDISAHSTPEVVYTAPADGLYVFVLDTFGNGNVAFTINLGTPGPDSGRACYLNSGDTIEHIGPVATISGVRLGDEISE